MTRQRGLTLIEVLVALVIGAIVVLTAHGLFAQSGDLAMSVTRQSHQKSRYANARRFVTLALESAEVGAGVETAFDGGPDSIGFATWLVEAGGDLKRSRLLFVQRDSLLLAVTSQDTCVVDSDLKSIGVDYLLEAGAASPWLAEWRSPATLPLAIRLRLGHRGAPGQVDTILVATGGRG